LADGTLEHVFFPFNISDIHWVVFMVDAVNCQIQYGDSLEWHWPSHETDLLNRWLCLHNFKSFRKGQTLPHGQQMDGFSCSIAMTNIVRHNLFGDPLFHNSNKHFLHIQEFLNIIMPHLKCHMKETGLDTATKSGPSDDDFEIVAAPPHAELPTPSATAEKATSEVPKTTRNGCIDTYFKLTTCEEHLEAI
jgi:hypothetical protein